MRLSDFIRANTERIIGQWEGFARTLTPVSSDMTPTALRNHIAQILTFIMEDMETSQTGPEQTEKSRGKGASPAPASEVIPSPAETHAALRLAGGFNLDQMVSEYRALRASVIKLWGAEHPEMDSETVQELTRFNESIDQELTESIAHYTKKLNDSKNMFLAILSHDLRNPLGAILGSTQLALKIGSLDERQTMLISQAVESTIRVNEIVTHLLDLTRARFGSGLPVVAIPMDFAFVSRQMVDEMRAAYPGREITLEIKGNTEGKWDKARIGQVFSNLIGNAVQYSFGDTPIAVTVTGGSESVILSVHNQGVPIPAERMGGIFDSLTRCSEDGQEQQPSTNLGLGLYITKEIVTAHGGVITVTSSERSGTMFSARFPRS
jgi:signal transduction histidine kinase